MIGRWPIYFNWRIGTITGRKAFIMPVGFWRLYLLCIYWGDDEPDAIGLQVSIFNNNFLVEQYDITVDKGNPALVFPTDLQQIEPPKATHFVFRVSGPGAIRIRSLNFYGYGE